MARQAGIKLTSRQRSILRKFMTTAEDKREYRAALGILLRADGKTSDYVVQKLNVTRKQVFMWCRKFKTKGADALHPRKQTGRPAKEGIKAKEAIPVILNQDPQDFGFLKGRWVLRALVIIRKISNGSRSARGANATAMLLSVIQTLRLKGEDILQELQGILKTTSGC